MSEMTRHGVVIECLNSAKNLDTPPAIKDILIRAAKENERLRDELVAIHTGLPFVAGFNKGWDAAVDSGEADNSKLLERPEPPFICIEAVPWGDGSSQTGTMNLVCHSMGIVIARDVDANIAREISRRCNSFKEAKD